MWSMYIVQGCQHSKRGGEGCGGGDARAAELSQKRRRESQAEWGAGKVGGSRFSVSLFL